MRYSFANQVVFCTFVLFTNFFLVFYGIPFILAGSIGSFLLVLLDLLFKLLKDMFCKGGKSLAGKVSIIGLLPNGEYIKVC